MRDVKAFSLLEMLVVTVIFMMIITITFGILTTGTNVQSTTMAQADIEEHGRRVVKQIADEIQMALKTSLNPLPPTTALPGIDSLSFQISEGFDLVGGVVIPSNTITIQFVPPDKVERTEIDDFGIPRTTILTHWVSFDPGTGESGLGFNLEGEDIIIILNLTREDNKERRLETFSFARVRMRNSAD